MGGCLRLRSCAVGLGFALAGEVGLLPGRVGLERGDPPGSKGDDEEHAGSGEEAPQPAIGPTFFLDFALGGDAAGLEELAFRRVQLDRVFGSPVECRAEACASVEIGRLAAALVPVARRADQVEPDLAALGVLLEPALQARPLAKESLVSDLDVPVAGRQQAGRREGFEDARDDGVVIGAELGQCHPSADETLALARSGEAQKHGPGSRLLTRREPRVRRLGEARHRAVEAAAGAIRSKRERTSLPRLPQLQERRREQWQDPRLGAGVRDQPADELRLHLEADPAGGSLDHGCQLSLRQWSYQDVVGADEAGQARVGRAVAVVVGAHGDDHAEAVAGRGQGIDEGLALGVVPRRPEDLLELVDGQHDLPAGCEAREGGSQRIGGLDAQGILVGHCASQGTAELRDRVLSWTHEGLDPALGTWQHASRQGRQETRPERRRLAAARGADEAEERAPDQAGDELGDQPLAPEVVVGVDRLERCEALVRADDDRGAGAGRAVGIETTDALANDLHALDVLDEPDLGAAQLAAAGFGPPCGLLEAVVGRAARPAGGQAVHGRRHAGRLVDQSAELVAVRGVAAVERRDRANGVGWQGSQGQAKLQGCQALDDGPKLGSGLLAVHDHQEA